MVEWNFNSFHSTKHLASVINDYKISSFSKIFVRKTWDDRERINGVVAEQPYFGKVFVS